MREKCDSSAALCYTSCCLRRQASARSSKPCSTAPDPTAQLRLAEMMPTAALNGLLMEVRQQKENRVCTPCLLTRAKFSMICFSDTWPLPSFRHSATRFFSATECINNPGFMLNSCAKSCGKCEGSRAVARRPAHRGCIDEADYGCAQRAAQGECDSAKGEMLWRCPSSCRVCAWASLLREALGCEDSHANCGEWARHGECQANPAFMMENCAQACKACESKRRSCDRGCHSLYY